MYRVCKTFEVEGGHFLSKHQEKCKNPHGHTRKIEVVVAGETLDENDMVCDFKVFKLALGQFIDAFDHSMMVNTDSPHHEYFKRNFERVISVEGKDPTTEVMAKMVFDGIRSEIAKGHVYATATGARYVFPPGLILERVRVWETASTWAEYSD